MFFGILLAGLNMLDKGHLMGKEDTHFSRLSDLLPDYLPLVRLVLFNRIAKLHRLCDVSGCG
jgi:hypothetical protein